MTFVKRARCQIARPGTAQRRSSRIGAFALGCCAGLYASHAFGQNIPPPVDQPYPGTIVLRVEATDLDRAIFRVHETLPVAAGPLTLLYPAWLPGTHSPSGDVSMLAGLTVQGAGQRIEWRRDPVDPFAFHLEVPRGVASLELDFQFLSPVKDDEGRITVTPEIVGIQWNTVTLYPAGFDAKRIAVQATAVVPDGWQIGTALELASQSHGEARFKDTDLATLVDSPLFVGKYFRRFDLDPGAKVPVYLDVVADRPESLEARPEQIEAHRNLVQQAYKVFGSHHYAHYDFLLSISDTFGFIGLEHHQSSENGVRPGYFTEWDRSAAGRDLLPHEYTHSWNGKFRRPADLTTPNFNVPMQDSLLWVYEGQTQYWGNVLAARSGLVSIAAARDDLASVAASYVNQPGRNWRNLQDTTNQPVISRRRGQPWQSWERSADYYRESQLIWLDVDTKIREMSSDTRSLDDFARSFFGVDDGSRGPLTYTFADLVAALNAVQPFDWASFLRARLDGHGPAPLDGLTRAGWRLVYSEERSDYQKSVEERRHLIGFQYSLGFTLDREDKLADVLWDGPLFKVGRTVGEKLLAVNGRSYKADLLRSAITAAKTSKAPIELLFKKEDLYTTVRLDYHGGLRYPHLERIDQTPDRLESILKPL